MTTQNKIAINVIDQAVEAAERASTLASEAAEQIKRLRTYTTYEPDESLVIHAPKVTVAEMRGAIQVAKFGSFTKAANSLGTSQPGLSRQIQRLELSFGFRIFERNGTGHDHTLTEKGAIVMTALNEAMSALASAKLATS